MDTVDEHEAIRDIPLFTQPLAPPADSEYEVAPPARSDHENNDIDLEHPPSPPTIDNETGEKPLSRFAGPMATGLSPIRDEFTTDNQETPLEKSQPDEKKVHKLLRELAMSFDVLNDRITINKRRILRR